MVGLLRHRSDRPKLAIGYLTLRFTADVFPRFSSISYSMCCPSLSVLSLVRSTRGDVHEYVFAACLRHDKSIALGRIEPLHGAARHFDSQVTIRGDVILIGDLVAKTTTELYTAVYRCAAAACRCRGASARRHPLRAGSVRRLRDRRSLAC